jgi:hypothetical protein
MTDPASLGVPLGGAPLLDPNSSFDILYLFLAPSRLYAQGFRAVIGS